MEIENSNFTLPGHYGVVLIPGMFPGGLNEFEVIIKEYGIRAYQIIDGSYNKPEYYKNNTFCLEIYCEKITQQIQEMKKYLDKVINISISYGGLISFILNQKLQIDGSFYISPICTNKGMNPKYEKRFVESLLGEKITCLPIWVNFFKMYGYNEAFFYYIAEFLKMRLSLIMNFDIHDFIKKGLHFEKPTVIYLAEREKDFLEWEKNHAEKSNMEELIHEIISLFANNKDKEEWENHVGLNLDKNINFTPLIHATGNYTIMTSISHPKLFLTHCEFTKHLTPYNHALKYLIESMENSTHLTNNTQYSLGEVLWKYIVQVLSIDIHSNNHDVELGKLSNNIIRIDNKNMFSKTNIIESFKAYWKKIDLKTRIIYKNQLCLKLNKTELILSETLNSIMSIINNITYE